MLDRIWYMIACGFMYSCCKWNLFLAQTLTKQTMILEYIQIDYHILRQPFCIQVSLSGVPQVSVCGP